MSKASWAKQPPDVQQAILKAAKDAEAWNRKAILEEDKGIQEQIRAKGVSITKPDATPFREATRPVYEDFYATPEGKSARKVVDHILSIK
jgi:TRAP-type C4-dicarboxylate transport system substrate-binding protein